MIEVPYQLIMVEFEDGTKHCFVGPPVNVESNMTVKNVHFSSTYTIDQELKAGEFLDFIFSSGIAFPPDDKGNGKGDKE